MNKATTVSFTAMADGTTEEYQLLREYELRHLRGAADRLLEALEAERHSVEGYRVTRYEHVLQSATRAARAGESEQYIVMALFHDIGDMLAPDCHGEVAAAALAPYLSDDLVWIVRHHGLFQTYYYAHHFGQDRFARDQYRDHPNYAACVRFCEDYDQCAFDPDYNSEPIEFFEPMVRRVLSLERRRTRGGPMPEELGRVAPEFRDLGEVSSAGYESRAFLFAKLGVTARHWRERADDGDEFGVRVELHRIQEMPGDNEFCFRELRLYEPIWRADLFSLSSGVAGNLARAHFHDRFDGAVPGDRIWDPEIARDPLSWLARRLSEIDRLLAASGRADLSGSDDASRIARAVPEIVEAVSRMFGALGLRPG